ncbi:MAG: LptA/OstA family protein [Myxococcales bacterium]|nr:LptA/OstA family protein [Polyangiaceae bacterium]MDW8250170.1 LptA/OstA family protein [Myxococcales bacterium]
MLRDRSSWVTLLGALPLACGGVLFAAPSPSSSPSPPPSTSSVVMDVPAPISSRSVSPAAFSWQGVPVKLRAARLRVDLATRSALLEGRVELRRKDATLRCQRLELRFDPQGQVLWARGTGRVLVETPELYAEAEEATFELAQSRVQLRGPVRAQKRGLKLEAAWASVDLFGQQLELTEVQGAVEP